MTNIDIYAPIRIEKLCESNLKDVLIKIFDQTILSQYCLKSKTRKFFVDYYIDLPNTKIAIEFDGHYHYTQTKSQIRDIELTELCIENNIVLIRIPYWVQIDFRTLKYYFLKYVETLPEITTIYKNGFWDPKITYPADFNKFGFGLYETQYHELKLFDHNITDEIEESLNIVDSRLSRDI